MGLTLTGRPFVERFALRYRTVVCPVCPVLSVTLVYCGQIVGWIKMPLGMVVNLGRGDVVLDGVAAPSERGTAPSFRFMSIVAKRLDG